MRHVLFLLLIISPVGSSAQTGGEDDAEVMVITPVDPTQPWDLEPPSSFAACRALETAAIEAENEAQRAAVAAVAPLPLPPVPRAPVRSGSSLYSDPDLREPLEVRADSGTVTLTEVHHKEDDEVVSLHRSRLLALRERAAVRRA